MEAHLPIMMMWQNEETQPQSLITKRRQPRVFRERVALSSFSEMEIRQQFRLSRQAIEELYSKLQPSLESKTKRSQAIPGMTKLIAVLHYLASGSFQYCVASKFGISQSAFSRIVHEVVEALYNVVNDYIKFPLTSLEQRQMMAKFYAKAGFPNILGLIDCTHVALIPPAQFEAIYRNRKLFHSLNVQIVCGPNFEILDVVASYPGSNHDSYILQQSLLGNMFANGSFGDGLLLGDNGYRLQSWLMTPYLNPSTAAEKKYNRAHVKTRTQVERLFGILKSRFRCLDITGGALLYKPEFVGKLVIACCILHNIANTHQIPIEIASDLREHIACQGEYRQEGTHEGRARQQEITHRFFRN
ncbi:putative nuclease HARBI1 [Hyla sarda]|uniref:putative nuclease HARBI1 n=1 Tax=Hyla sarda TaxID=327740 RepID=UPI0024C31A1D|nr:putative nuclease HARBI1 [Hyla sarda]XP_056386675.1 putative nuclease HARBI1 [Hyla sarda]